MVVTVALLGRDEVEIREVRGRVSHVVGGWTRPAQGQTHSNCTVCVCERECVS